MRTREGVEGVLFEIHHTNDRHGSYGRMRTDDGETFVWSAGLFYRNGSFILLGERYRFNVVEYIYCTEIDLLDKPAAHARMREKNGPDVF